MTGCIPWGCLRHLSCNVTPDSLGPCDDPAHPFAPQGGSAGGDKVKKLKAELAALRKAHKEAEDALLAKIKYVALKDTPRQQLRWL